MGASLGARKSGSIHLPSLSVYLTLPLTLFFRCFFWDQTTNYTVVDEEKERKVEEQRLEEFGNWLDQQDEQDLPEELRLQVEVDPQ